MFFTKLNIIQLKTLFYNTNNFLQTTKSWTDHPTWRGPYQTIQPQQQQQQHRQHRNRQKVKGSESDLHRHDANANVVDVGGGFGRQPIKILIGTKKQKLSTTAFKCLFVECDSKIFQRQSIKILEFLKTSVHNHSRHF